MPEWKTTNSGVDAIRKKTVDAIESYVRIHEFLVDEARVGAQLERLASDSRAASVDAFMAYLTACEKAAGFTEAAVELNSTLTPKAFMMEIQAGRPLVDIGVDPLHGALTHRIQWAMIANELFAQERTRVAALYSALGAANAWKKDPTLWGLLVDCPYQIGSEQDWVYNARSPDFLMAYMKDYPDSGVRKLHEFSASLAKGVE
jgi:hypothetical protein